MVSILLRKNIVYVYGKIILKILLFIAPKKKEESLVN